MNKELKWVNEEFEEEIAKKTGFDISKINLILSKRSDKNISEIDYHKFEYNGNIYTLEKDKLSQTKHNNLHD